jgi:hypothetical protein
MLRAIRALLGVPPLLLNRLPESQVILRKLGIDLAQFLVVGIRLLLGFLFLELLPPCRQLLLALGFLSFPLDNRLFPPVQLRLTRIGFVGWRCRYGKRFLGFNVGSG